MAGSFYDQILQGLGGDTPLPEIAAGGTRLPGGAGYDVPASGLDEATKARLAAMRAADAASVNAARTAAVAPNAAAAAAPAAPAAASPGLGARIGSVLNPDMGTLLRGAGIVAKGAAKASAVAAPVIGGAEALLDSPQNVQNLGANLGFDASSGVGRVGANVLNFLQKTGNAATFGLAGRLGHVLGGGSFSDSDTPAAAAPAPVSSASSGPPGAPDLNTSTTDDQRASVASVQAQDAAGQPTPAPQEDPTLTAVRAAMNFQPPQAPQTQLVPIGAPRQYGGYIQRTGGGDNIDGVPVAGQGAPGERVDLPSGATQTYGVRKPTLAQNIDYALERNAARADQKTRIASAQLGVALVGAGKRNAEEQKIHILGQLAAEHLRANRGDLAGAAAIMSGKDLKEAVGTVSNGMNTGVVTRNHTIISTDANGNATEKNIYDTPTENDVAKMKSNGSNADYKSSFIRRFGPDAYKTYIGSR